MRTTPARAVVWLCPDNDPVATAPPARNERRHKPLFVIRYENTTVGLGDLRYGRWDSDLPPTAGTLAAGDSRWVAGD